MRRNVAFYQNLVQFSGVALSTELESISYYDLEERVALHSEELIEHCMNDKQESCLAALVFDHSIDAVVNYLAALRSRVPLLLVDPELEVEQKKLLYEQLGVSVVLNGRAIMPVAPWPYRDVQPHTEASLATPALLMSTSGSSGAPKSVMLSLDNLSANTQSILEFLPICSADCAITTLPLHYSFGLSILNTHLAVGAQVVLTNHPMMSKAFWHLVRERGITSLSGVPFHYQMLQMLRVERMELPKLKYLTQAGGRLEPVLVEHFAKVAKTREWQFFVMYGQTEATARMAYIPEDQVLAHPDVIGQSIPGGNFEIHSLQEDELIGDPNIEGELWYFGDNVMLGYAQTPEDWQAEIFPRKGLATGDLAEWTDSGFVRITGRRSRMIKIRGKRIQLDHLEQRLKQEHKDVICCGKDDMLYVVNARSNESIAAFLRESLHIHPSLFATMQLQEVPRKSNGKVDFVQLLEQCELEVNKS